MHVEWPRHLRDQAEAAGVPFFYKQTGEYIPATSYPGYPKTAPAKQYWRNVSSEKGKAPNLMFRVGTSNSGNTLDGKTYLQQPNV